MAVFERYINWPYNKIVLISKVFHNSSWYPCREYIEGKLFRFHYTGGAIALPEDKKFCWVYEGFSNEIAPGFTLNLDHVEGTILDDPDNNY